MDSVLIGKGGLLRSGQPVKIDHRDETILISYLERSCQLEAELEFPYSANATLLQNMGMSLRRKKTTG